MRKGGRSENLKAGTRRTGNRLLLVLVFAGGRGFARDQPLRPFPRHLLPPKHSTRCCTEREREKDEGRSQTLVKVI